MSTKKHKKTRNYYKKGNTKRRGISNKTTRKNGKIVNSNSISFYNKPPEVVSINGYKFLLLPVKKGSFLITCKIFGGTYLEKKENIGISHLLEHIITRAWHKCCKIGCVKHIEKYGTFSNAHTMLMSTGYWIKGLPKYQEVLMEYILSSILDPCIMRKTLTEEKEAVRNEITNYINAPNYELTDKTCKTLFKNEGMQYSFDYKRQLRILDSFTIKQIIDFSKTIVSENRIIFSISGEFNKIKLLNSIKGILKKLSYTKIPLCMPKLNSALCYNNEKCVKFVKNSGNTNSTIEIQFPLNIYYGDKIRLYIPLITEIFGSGLNSLLLNELRNKENLVYSASVTTSTNFCGTLISFSIFTINKNVEEVLRKIFDIIKKYKKEYITESLLNHFKIRYMLKLKEICLNCVNSVNEFYSPQYFYQLNVDNPKIYTIREITNLVENVNREKVLQLCKQLFDLNNCIVCYSSKNKIKFTVDDF